MTTTKAQKPKYQVVDDTFVAQSDQGEIRIRLGFKTKLLRQIRETGDEMDQLFALLDGIGDAKTSGQLDELDIFDTTDIVTEYFAAFEAKQNARLGEASASSAS